MHPEVLSPKPGACPKCGMALEPTQPAAPEHTEYTCPMHPQIVRDGPGTCPICGMALEPRTVTASAANPELISMTRRLWIGAVSDTPTARRHGLRRSTRPSAPTPSARAAFGLDGTNPGDPGGPVGRMALLRARLGFDRSSQPEHVHPHRDRKRSSLPLQCGCGARPRPLSCHLP